MPVKQFKPTSPSVRGMSVSSFEEITKSKPEKSLISHRKVNAGRNNRGKITVRHQGGGERRALRLVDFKRYDKTNVPGRVLGIEYDPNRSTRIALIQYADGDKRYILAPVTMKVGDIVLAGPEVEARDGNSLPLKAIPPGSSIHCIELQRGRGGQIVRSAGTAAQLLAKEGAWSTVRLPSGEMRRVDSECYATIGQLGNPEHKTIKLGKAGKSRHLGIRPNVRGKAMTPRDHPHGGGEGKNPIGHPGPLTPWAMPSRGYRTRKNKRTTKFIVKRRD